MKSSAHRLLTSATVFAILLLGGCAVPHSAKVPTGGWAALQVGGGVVAVQHDLCGDGCSPGEPAEVVPVPLAHISAGYGWRDRAHPVLLYLTAPVMPVGTVGDAAVGALIGASAGAYVELGGDGTTEAYGVGASINLASIVATALQPIELGEWVHPAAQLYAMAGGRVGDAWIDAGVRGGVLLASGVGGGGFASARWDLDAARVGVWFDAAVTTESFFNSDDGGFWYPVVATAGVMVEPW